MISHCLANTRWRHATLDTLSRPLSSSNLQVNCEFDMTNCLSWLLVLPRWAGEFIFSCLCFRFDLILGLFSKLERRVVWEVLVWDELQSPSSVVPRPFPSTVFILSPSSRHLNAIKLLKLLSGSYTLSYYRKRFYSGYMGSLSSQFGEMRFFIIQPTSTLLGPLVVGAGGI